MRCSASIWAATPLRSKRPLICLNRAHHPVVVATAFAHEVGHHVTADLFSVPSESVRLARLAGIEAHLSEPRELAADVLVSLRSSSGPRWRKNGSMQSRLEKLTRSRLSSGGCVALGSIWEACPVRRRHQYQALLIHFVKLRQALLPRIRHLVGCRKKILVGRIESLRPRTLLCLPKTID